MEKLPNKEVDDTKSAKSGAYFPQQYLTDMFRFFKQHNEEIEIITYRDLCWDTNDYDFEGWYPSEKQAWLNRIDSGQIDPKKAYVLIQYDLDSRPERAMSLLSHAEHSDIPANVMRFNQRIDRKRLKTCDEVMLTEYDINTQLLQKLEAEGFLIGLHSNCYERSHHDASLAKKILASDIEELQKKHTIDFYTAHGGVPCAEGLNNRDVPPSANVAKTVRWVHNGATPYFTSQFSDGGHNSPVRDPADRDLRDFVKNMKPGGRYRILIHPQYYDVLFTKSARYTGTTWYDAMTDELEREGVTDTWGTVDLPLFNPDHEIYLESDVNPVKVVNKSLIHRIFRRIKKLLKSK